MPSPPLSRCQKASWRTPSAAEAPGAQPASDPDRGDAADGGEGADEHLAAGEALSGRGCRERARPMVQCHDLTPS